MALKMPLGSFQTCWFLVVAAGCVVAGVSLFSVTVSKHLRLGRRPVKLPVLEVKGHMLAALSSRESLWLSCDSADGIMMRVCEREQAVIGQGGSKGPSGPVCLFFKNHNLTFKTY